MRARVVHRSYSATHRQIGHIYDGWRIVARRRISRLLRCLYGGKVWEFLGERLQGS